MTRRRRRWTDTVRTPRRSHVQLRRRGMPAAWGRRPDAGGEAALGRSCPTAAPATSIWSCACYGSGPLVSTSRSGAAFVTDAPPAPLGPRPVVVPLARHREKGRRMRAPPTSAKQVANVAGHVDRRFDLDFAIREALYVDAER